MDRTVKIIIALIAALLFLVVGLVMVGEDFGRDRGRHVVSEKEWKDMDEGAQDHFVDSSQWRMYTSDEYAYEVRFPFEWEFNLTDGTVFYPEICARNKFDKCIGRVRIGVYKNAESTGRVSDHSQKCDDATKIDLRHIDADVWVCEKRMSGDFLHTQGYDIVREYYFDDKRGNTFEIGVMFVRGESIVLEKEIIQTIKLIE